MARKKVLAPIFGVDQLSDETSLLQTEEAQAVREAVNVNIDRDGNVSRRKGATLQLAGAGYHSFYKAKSGLLIVCHKEEIGIYTPSTATFAPLVYMDEAFLTSFTELNGNLYAMNSGYSCMFPEGSLVGTTIGTPLPSVTPQFAAAVNGGLDIGTYGVTYSIIDPNGEESELGPVVTVELASGGGIQGVAFTIIAGYKYRIYMTTADGEELYQAAEFNADVVSFLIGSHEEGRQPRTQYLELLPNGYTIRTYNSRLFIATTGFVYFSEAFRPHMYSPVNNFIPTTGVTTMLQPVDNGVYIGDQRGVKFYEGEDPTEFRVKEVSAEVPVYNTAIAVPGEFLNAELGVGRDHVAVWLTASGFNVGMPNGELLRLHSHQVKLPAYVQGCTALLEQEGRKQLITPVNSNVAGAVNIAIDSTFQ